MTQPVVDGDNDKVMSCEEVSRILHSTTGSVSTTMEEHHHCMIGSWVQSLYNVHSINYTMYQTNILSMVAIANGIQNNDVVYEYIIRQFRN